MINETFSIDLPYDSLGCKHQGNATITTYIKEMYPDNQDSFNRPLMIIIPGGGYGHLSVREGEAVAIKMLDLGYNAMVLRYSLTPDIYPTQLYEGLYAVNYAREHAVEWDCNPDKIIVCGFSAGGHVAGLVGTKWNSEEIDDFLEVMGLTHKDVKPNGLCLGYPVVTSGKYAHRGSFEKSLGDRYDELLDNVSVELCVTSDMPKCFVWHTYEDNSVPLENSLLLVNALRNNGIQFEYHVFACGCHGLALGTKETASKGGNHYEPLVSTWPELFKNWMEVMYE